MKIGAIALNTWRETMRDRLLIAVLAIVLAIAAVALATEGTGAGRAQAALDLGLSAMGAAGTLVAIFLGTSLVHKELDRRTVYVVLTKPVSRFEFLIGKFLGLMATLTLMAALMGVGLAGLMAIAGHWDPQLFGVLAGVWMQLGLVTAMAFCFASITSGTLAAVYTLGLFALGQQTLLIRQFAESEAKLNQFNHWVGKALYYVLPNFGAFDYKNTVLYGGQMPWAAWGWGLGYGAALSAALLVVAALAWEDRVLP
jgi:ABC-type transport system involved in multi-copper enzyme maturation permease subunit